MSSPINKIPLLLYVYTLSSMPNRSQYTCVKKSTQTCPSMTSTLTPLCSDENTCELIQLSPSYKFALICVCVLFGQPQSPAQKPRIDFICDQARWIGGRHGTPRS